jgi:putative colanic acid biosynthesis glycosyltransferase
LTGRCALPDGCTNWKHSCGSCKTLDNYPPVWLDQSASNFNNKRAYLLKLIEYGCKFVAPSFHLAYQVENVIKNLKMTVIQNGLDLDSEKVILNFSSVKERAKVQHDKVKIMVIAHDLAYAGKTNHPLIYKLMKELNIQLHTVGKNSPFEGDDVINHGYISSKINLINIYIEMDLMLFTSQVDNFPLVIGESLCIGLPVIATGSKASSEVLALIGAKPTADESQLLDIIKNKSWLKELYNGDSLDTIKDKAKIEFSGERVLNDYKKLYRSS